MAGACEVLAQAGQNLQRGTATQKFAVADTTRVEARPHSLQRAAAVSNPITGMCYVRWHVATTPPHWS